MAECNLQFPKPVPADSSRKRISQPKKWKLSLEKKARYKSQDLPSYPSCQHAKKPYRSSTLLMQDIKQLHKNFYSHNAT
ncbi:hypothetical protein HHI36_002203, partial [Cryptolaemus montrouzieri]